MSIENRPFIFFDYDGVLINTFLEALETNHDIGIPLTADEYRQLFTGNIFSSVLKKHPKDALELATQYVKRYYERTHRMNIHPSMEHLIRNLAQKYYLCVISSGSERTIKTQLMNSHVLDCFIDVLGHETETSKVKKIKSIFETYHLGREKSVFVTDTLGDIKEAHEAGVRVIAVTWGFHDKAMLSEGNPEYIVNTPEELQETIESLF